MEGTTKDEPELCQTRLIADQITSADAFQHKAIASAIAEMMLSEVGGCAIALTGAWGSGKSTVVSLLKAQLKKGNESFETFIFDSWAHQGDPLRRTFLEKLIGWCGDPERLWTTRRDHWNSVIKELARRREISKTTSTPNVRWLGAAGAISLLLTPLALQVYLKNQYQDHPRWDRAGFFFSIVPALIAMGVAIFWMFTELNKKKEDRKTLPSFVFTESDRTVESETSKTPDPTSVEFEKIYRALMDEVLANQERRVLIVVDNLDRIDHQNARSIWATLRVFFDVPDGEPCEWRSRVWVLVPFDPGAIDDLWEVPVSPDSTDRKSMSRHFLEKTFQSTFRVPPILFSNWEKFLLAQLRFAFPDARHTGEEFHTVFRVYDRLRTTEAGASPTPRNIKIFVNTIGALHRQWQHIIPLTHQAAFAAISDRPAEQILGILLGADTQTFNTQTLNTLLQEGWQRDIAALYFNVPPEAATEALLRPQIQLALQQGDAEKLVGLQNVPGFADVFETFIEAPVISTSIEAPQFARLAIGFSKLTGKGHSYDQSRAHLYRIAARFKKWEPFDSKVADAIRIVAEFGELDPTPLIRGVRDSLQVGPVVPMDAQNWCEGVAAVLPALAKHDDLAVGREFKVLGDGNDFTTVIDQARRISAFKDLWKYMKPAAPQDEILSLLTEPASGGRWGPADVDMVQTLTKIVGTWNWALLIPAFQSRLQESTPSLADDIPPLIETAFFLASNSAEVRQLLEGEAKSETLCYHFHLLGLAGNWNVAGMCCLPLLSCDTDLSRPNQAFTQNSAPWRIQQGRNYLYSHLQDPDSNPELLGYVTGRFLTWLPFEQWREIAEGRPDRKRFIGRLLAGHIQEDHTSVSATELLEHMNFWNEVAGEEMTQTLLSEKGPSGELATALTRNEFSIQTQHLYLLALSTGKTADLVKLICQGLQGVSESEWLDAMVNETELLDLILALKEAEPRLARTFQDALDAHAEKKLVDQSVGRLARSWVDIVSALDSTSAGAFRQRMLNRFRDGEGRIRGLLPYYGPLLSSVVSEDGPEKSFERVKQIIELHDPTELNWLGNLMEIVKARKRSDISEDWANRVSERLNQSELTVEDREALAHLLDVLRS